MLSTLFRLSAKCFVVSCVFVTLTIAQPAPEPVNADAQPTDQSMIQLNFPKDVELTVLVEYVSQRLGVNFIYDEQLANKRLTIKAPEQIPASSLIGLLESALHIKGFTLIEAPEPGFMRIAPAAEMTAVTQLTEDSGKAQAQGVTTAMTQVIPLKHADSKLIEAALKPYLSKPGGNIFSLPDQDMLVISDMAVNVRRIVEMISLLDQPTPERRIEIFTLTHAQSKELAQKIKQIMQLKDRVRSRRSPSSNQSVECVSDDRTNQVMAIGTPEQLEDVKAMIQSLDIPIPESQNPVRFYKLLHRSAEDVLATLKNIQGDEGLQTTTIQNLFENNQADITSPGTIPSPAAAFGEPAHANAGDTITPTPNPRGNSTDNPQATNAAVESAPGLRTVPNARNLQQSPTVKPTLARVAADIHTNSIVVVAKPPVQQIYAALIKELDRRHPQVLLEATVVTLDTSDNFSLGVEIAVNGSADGGKIVSFSSFGLSTINATTGAVTPGASTGFNFSLFNADVADVVLKALKRTGRAKVASAPKILVNDNETGTLKSSSQEPFEQVNASDTVATTSFGGYVDAGTDISMTPHISNGDYLQLEYSIQLSSFTGERIGSQPPPRQENIIGSKVTIPDGQTIVLGGLKRTTLSNTITKIPILGEIPILEHLFSSQLKETSEGTLFVFIKASILRDDQFRDLHTISEYDVKTSEQSGDYPMNQPQWMN